MDTIETYADEAGDHRWRRTGQNGEIMGVGGDGYTRERDAYRAAVRSLEGEICIARPDGRKVYFTLVPVMKREPGPSQDAL